MKTLRALSALSVILASVGCQSGKHIATVVAPSTGVASSKIYYAFDESFRTYFGPEGVASVEQRLREMYPKHEIERITFDTDK